MVFNVVCAMQTGYLKMVNLAYTAPVFLAGNGSVIEAEKDDAGKVAGGYDIDELLNRTGAEANGGPLAPLVDFVKDYGSGTLNLGQMVLVYAVAICMLGSSLAILFGGGDTQKQANNKVGLLYRIFGGVLGFAAVAIVTVMHLIGSGLFK